MNGTNTSKISTHSLTHWLTGIRFANCIPLPGGTAMGVHWVWVYSLSRQIYIIDIIREIHLHGIICTHSLDSLWSGGFTSQTLEDTVNWKGTLASLNPIASPFLNHPTMHRSPPTNTFAHFAASLNWTRRIHSFGGVAATVLGLWRSSSRVLCTWGCLCASVVRPASANWQLGDGTVVVRRRNTHGRMPPTTTTAQTQHRSLAVYIQNYYCAAPPHRAGEKSETTSLDTRPTTTILHAHGRERGDLWRQQRCRRRRPCPRCIPLI